MEKIINTLFKVFFDGVDTYTHNGSTWLIFTNEKKWVIELTKEKTLWYNYTFFKQIFEFASLNVVDNQDYITKWVEDKIINKTENTYFRDARDRKQQFEDTLENGIYHTEIGWHQCNNVDNTIENGVKKTQGTPGWIHYPKTSNVIDNSVKEIHDDVYHHKGRIDGVIQNGIKETNSWNESIIGDLNQNGCIDVVIKEGVKKTINHNCESNDFMAAIVIKEGVKETIVSDYNGYGVDYFITDQEIVNNVIDKGELVSGTFVGGSRQKENIDVVIDYGVKETKHANKYESIGPVFKQHKIDDVIENGIKNPTD